MFGRFGVPATEVAGTKSSAGRHSRAVAVAAAVAVSGVLVAGCGGGNSGKSGGNAGSANSSSPTSSPSAKTTTATSVAAKTGGTLRIVLPSPPEALDPLVGARTAEYVWGTMLEPFVAAAPNLEPSTTGLATSFKQVKPTDWHFDVRPGVKFTDGESADASAVAYSILQNKNNSAAILKGYFGNVKTVKVNSPTSLDVITSKPQLDLPDLFTTLYVVPPKYYAKQGTKGFTAHPIGTGPYEWESQQPGQSITVKANPDYWGPKPKLNSIRFTWATDPTERLNLVQSGAADVAMDLPPQQAQQASGAGLNVISKPTEIKISLFLAANQPPLKGNTNLRKAIQMAINRQQIVNAIFQGKAKVDGSLLDIAPGVQGAPASPYNPTEARKLAAGAPPITITYPIGQGTDIDSVAQAIQGQLQAVGINAKLNPLSYAAQNALVFKHTITGAYLQTAIANIANPDFFAEGFLTSTSISANCPDPRFDSQTEQALTASDQATADALYNKLDQEATDEDACFVPLYDEIFNIAMAKNVVGFDYTPLNLVGYNNVGFS